MTFYSSHNSYCRNITSILTKKNCQLHCILQKYWHTWNNCITHKKSKIIETKLKRTKWRSSIMKINKKEYKINKFSLNYRKTRATKQFNIIILWNKEICSPVQFAMWRICSQCYIDEKFPVIDWHSAQFWTESRRGP